MALAPTPAPRRFRRDLTTGGRRPRRRRALLACGVGYPVFYVVTNDLIAAARYDGHSRMDQAISELSAKGAPTRPFLVAMLPLYTALLLAFGAGVWQSAGVNRALRGTGVVIVASGVTGVMWLPFPMTGRAEMARGATGANDVGHLVLSGLTGVTAVALCSLGAVALGRRFRIYSVATLATTATFAGVLTGTLSPNMAKGRPTPRLGLYERLGLYAFYTWLAALAVTLVRRPPDGARSTGEWVGVMPAAP